MSEEAPAVETTPATARGVPRSDRVRLVLVAALALGVMGGVVASALVARARTHEEDRLSSASPLAPPIPTERFGRGKPMPSGCEVDPASPPVLVVDLPGNRLDFGPLRQGVKVEKPVTVRNTGSGVLCIRDIETGCGCVKAEWNGEARIPPSASGSFTVRVDTTGKEGSQDKWVTLYTNEPLHPTVVVTVSIEVRLGIVVGSAPGYPGSLLVFGTHAPAHPATAALRLKSPKNEAEWSILGVDSLAPPDRRVPFTWQLVPVEPNDPTFRCYDLRITHPGRVETGLDEQPLRVRTSHPERPEILVDSRLTVETKFYAAPSRATFGFVRPSAAPPRKTIAVRAGEGGTDFTVKGATIDGAGFAVETPVRTKEGWAVDVRYDGKSRETGAVRATLVVSIDDPELPELRVPLEAMATGG